MVIVVLTTILTLSALYAPQPLLPVFAGEFDVSRETAALLTTIVFFPLSIAPLFYGYLLEDLPPRRMLRAAVLLLALSELAFFLAGTFPLLLAIRLIQGLLIPAILTALMTFLAQSTEKRRVARTMAIYVAATILGGFLGRLCSGMIATWLGWRISFLFLAASLLFCFFLLARLPSRAAPRKGGPGLDEMRKVLGHGAYWKIYLSIFSLFLVFAAVMNFLPFRLTELSEQATEFRIGLMYTGYVMGMVTSLNAVRAARWLGGEVRCMVLGFSLFGAALLGLGTGRVILLFLVMFLFCGAMFLIHATASGLLNRLAGEGKGLVNGLYVSFYYGGGTVGSYLPGIPYRHWGWGAFLLALFMVTLFGMTTAWTLRREVSPE